MVVKKLVVIAVFISLLTGCIKYELPKFEYPEPTMPEITQEGKNTFGFYLNGEEWLTRFNFLSAVVPLGFNYDKGRFNLFANRINSKTNTDQSIIITIQDSVFTEGKYKLFQYDKSGAEFRDGVDSCSYTTSTQYGGEITITKLDTSNKIVAGTFYMTLVNDKCETLHITDGRFDFKYPY